MGGDLRTTTFFYSKICSFFYFFLIIFLIYFIKLFGQEEENLPHCDYIITNDQIIVFDDMILQEPIVYGRNMM